MAPKYSKIYFNNIHRHFKISFKVHVEHLTETNDVHDNSFPH